MNRSIPKEVIVMLKQKCFVLVVGTELSTTILVDSLPFQKLCTLLNVATLVSDDNRGYSFKRNCITYV